MRFGLYVIIMVSLLSCMLGGAVMAQTAKVKVHGRVTDASTGQPIPYVQVVVEQRGQGVMTDAEGYYLITVDNESVSLNFSMMGYRTLTKRHKKGQSGTMNVQLHSATDQLREFVVKGAKQKRTRYRRKGNPAVELVSAAVEHKHQNRVDAQEAYQRSCYMKSTLSINKFDPNFQRWFWRPIRFLEPYVDHTDLSCARLGLLMAECLNREYFHQEWDSTARALFARHDLGFGNIAEFDEMIAPFEIYDNDIAFMSEHFTGPLSSYGITFYHYQILDTVEIEGDRCIAVAFTPANKESMGFVGELFIVDDTNSYAVKRYHLTLNPHINLNYLSDLDIMQYYHRAADSLILPSERYMDVALKMTRWMPYLRIHQEVVCGSYGFDTIIPAIDTTFHVVPADSLYSLTTVREQDSFHVFFHSHDYDSDSIHRAKGVPFGKECYTTHPEPLPWKLADNEKDTMPDSCWARIRPIPFVGKEDLVGAMVDDIKHLPIAQFNYKLALAILSGYAPTTKDPDSSRFDIGPIYNLYSVNQEEGIRLRMGGTTTTMLSKRDFANGYVAYGSLDHRVKGGVQLIHSFNDKEKHAQEWPQQTLSLEARYDLEDAGIPTGNMDRDNILMTTSERRSTEYVAKGALDLRYDWRSHLSLIGGIAVRQCTPAIGLRYNRILADGSLEPVGEYQDASCSLQLQYAPQEQRSSTRQDYSKVTRRGRNSVKLTLTQTAGLMTGGFQYNKTEMKAESRLFLGPLGRLQMNLMMGAEWNRAPVAKLFYPPQNTSLLISAGGFKLMQPVEFAMDHYLCFFGTYNMRGLIVNHIPLIRNWHLREIVSYSLLWGGLTERNNPYSTHMDVTGLYQLPAGCQPLGRTPYMEVSVGLSNFFKCIRVDYVWRLTYLDGVPAAYKGGFRYGYVLEF